MTITVSPRQVSYHHSNALILMAQWQCNHHQGNTFIITSSPWVQFHSVAKILKVKITITMTSHHLINITMATRTTCDADIYIDIFICHRVVLTYMSFPTRYVATATEYCIVAYVYTFLTMSVALLIS